MEAGAANNGALSGAWVPTLVFGVIGWIFEENGIPVAPAILGIVLGDAFEFNFVTSMIKSDGSLLIFFERPIATFLAISVLLVWALPLYRTLKRLI